MTSKATDSTTKEVAVTMDKDLAKKLAGLSEKYGVKGANKNITQSDIELKRLKLSQGTSDIVQEGKMPVGRFYNSQDSTELGSADSPAEFILFYMDKVWMEYDLVWNEKKQEDVREFKRVVPVTAENADLDYIEEANKVARDFTYNYYLLSVKELEKGASIPYVFSMSRIQTKSAKNLNSKLSEIAANGLPSFAYVFEFSCEGKQKGEGEDIKKWQQIIVNTGRISSDSEMEEANRWFEILDQQASEIKVQGETVAGESAVEDGAVKATEVADDEDTPF